MIKGREGDEGVVVVGMIEGWGKEGAIKGVIKGEYIREGGGGVIKRRER